MRAQPPPQPPSPSAFTQPVGRKQWISASVPFAILIVIHYVVLGIPALHSGLALANIRNADMTVKVTGHQWHWRRIGQLGMCV